MHIQSVILFGAFVACLVGTEETILALINAEENRRRSDAFLHATKMVYNAH